MLVCPSSMQTHQFVIFMHVSRRACFRIEGAREVFTLDFGSSYVCATSCILLLLLWPENGGGLDGCLRLLAWDGFGLRDGLL